MRQDESVFHLLIFWKKKIFKAAFYKLLQHKGAFYFVVAIIIIRNSEKLGIV